MIFVAAERRQHAKDGFDRVGDATQVVGGGIHNSLF